MCFTDVHSKKCLGCRYRSLNAAWNSFSGTIPPSWALLTRLSTMNLSNNNFYGSVPDGLSLLSLATYV